MRSVSTSSLVALIAAACLALVLLLLLDRGVAAALAKLVASSGFVALAVQVGALRSVYGRIILLGLAFSWLGDAALIGESHRAFLVGLGAFLVAHLAYIVAFVISGLSAKWVGAAVIPILGIGVAVAAWLNPYLTEELRLPVISYIVVISLMVVSAFGARGRGASILVVAGAIAFFLSDLSVAALRLVRTDLPAFIPGLPLYYAAQVCLALSISRSRDPTGASRRNGPQENR